MKVSDVPTPGKPRQILAFELRMNIIADATIDLLFTKNRVFTVLSCLVLQMVIRKQILSPFNNPQSIILYRRQMQSM